MMSIKSAFYSLGATENDITARPPCIGLMFAQRSSSTKHWYNAVQFFSKLTAIQFIRATERVKRKVVEGGFGAQSIERTSSAAQSSG